MKCKNGFVLIETIIVTVVLTVSLLFIYSSYSTIISTEETRLYYDDVAYIYKTNYVRKFLQQYSDIENIKTYAFVGNQTGNEDDTGTYIISIGTGYTSMFNNLQISEGMDYSFEAIINNFNINQILLVDTDYFEVCFKDSVKCDNSTSSLSANIKRYLNTLSDTSYEYYLVVEYTEKLDDNGNITKCTPGATSSSTVGTEGCNVYYASLGI